MTIYLAGRTFGWLCVNTAFVLLVFVPNVSCSVSQVLAE